MFQLRWVWKNLGKKHQILQILCLVIELATVFLVLINPWLSGEMMDKVFVDQNIDLLLPILGAMMGVWFVRQGLRYIMHTTMEMNGLKLVANLRNPLFRNLQYQDTAYFDHRRTGDIMTRLSADINWVGHFISTLMQQTIDCVIMFLAVLIYFGRPVQNYLLAGLILLGFAYGGLQWWALAAIPLLAVYNDQRGKYNIGKLFYIYYPLHLVAIYGLSLLIR